MAKCEPGCVCDRHKKCLPGCACKRHKNGAKPCEPSCTCGLHRKRLCSPGCTCGLHKKCSPGCTCYKHTNGTKVCVPGCECGLHTPVRGPDSPFWQNDLNSYDAAHRRVYHFRGKASEHACVDCGEQAREWSYRGPSGEYSMNIDDYDPRCVSCHRVFDSQVRT